MAIFNSYVKLPEGIEYHVKVYVSGQHTSTYSICWSICLHGFDAFFVGA